MKKAMKKAPANRKKPNRHSNSRLNHTFGKQSKDKHSKAKKQYMLNRANRHEKDKTNINPNNTQSAILLACPIMLMSSWTIKIPYLNILLKVPYKFSWSF
jgi:hypothetical protein